MTPDLTGQVAIVTGASSGIGRHVSELFAGHGATVVAAARRQDRLAELAARSERIIPVPCDVVVADDCARVIERAVDLGGPHILVNAAGFGDAQPALETSVEDFRHVVDVDLTATFEMSVRAAKAMPNGGTIINIASIFGLVGTWPVTQTAYAAAKGGVVNLTRALGVEWARQGIRVNAVAPGFFPSEQTDDMFADDRAMAWLRRNNPMGRPGDLAELDGAVLLFASSASSYITGQILAVDGGWTAR